MYDRHKNIKALQRSKLLAAQLPIYIHQHVRNTWPGAEQYCDVTHNGSDEKPIKVIIEGRKFILYDPDTKTTYQTIEELHTAGIKEAWISFYYQIIPSQLIEKE